MTDVHVNQADAGSANGLAGTSATPPAVSAEYRSKVIDIFRLAVITLMITVHIPYNIDSQRLKSVYQSVFSGGAWLSDLWFVICENAMIFLQHGLGRGSVAALTLISAWFVVGALQKRSPSRVAWGRVTSLGAPYLFWNAVFFVFAVFLLREQLSNISLQRIFGGGEWPLNYPLHFILDILISSVAFILVHSAIGFRPALIVLAGSVLALASLTLGEHRFEFGDNGYSFFPRAQIIFTFFLGAATGRIWKRIFEVRVVNFLRSGYCLTALGAAAFTSSYVLGFGASRISLEPELLGVSYFVVSIGARLLCAAFVFCVVLRLTRNSVPDISRRLAFRIFCSHLMAIWIAVALVPLSVQETFPLVFFAICFAACIGLGVLVHRSVEFLAGKFYPGIRAYI